MARFIVKRLLMLPIAIFAANLFGFAYPLLVAPIRRAQNPYAAALYQLPDLGSEYLKYLQGVVHFDFGRLPSSSTTVIQSIGQGIAATSGLLVIAILLSSVVGLALGLWAVRYNPPRLAGWLTLLTTIGLASPSFFLGILLITLSIVILLFGPTNQPLVPFQGFGWDAHLVLPTLALMVQPTVKVAQVTSGLLVGELSKQYVVAARSFGHSWRAIRNRQALRNVLASVILTISSSLRIMVAEIIIVERLFSWPGIGRLISQTLVTSSSGSPLYLYPPMVAALTTGLAVLFLLADLAASLLVRWVDPRIRSV